MDLDFFNNLKDFFAQNNDTEDFTKNLSNYLEKNEKGILKQIEEQRKTSVATRNTMKVKMKEILSNYSLETANKGDLYFIASKEENEFSTYKYENGERQIIKLNENELPVNAEVNSALRFENGEYILDNEATNILKEKITNMANKMLDAQDEELKEFRKEGHLYRVEEQRENRVYLVDETENNGLVLEEVDFPEELLNKASEGITFKYENREYI